MGVAGNPCRDVFNSSVIFSAYGRAATAASCARRSFAAETIFMALVICWVLRIELIRLRIALRVAMSFFAGTMRAGGPALEEGFKPAPARFLSRHPLSAAPCLGFEYPFELFQGLVQLSPEIVIQFALFQNVSQNIRVLGFDKRI